MVELFVISRRLQGCIDALPFFVTEASCLLAQLVLVVENGGPRWLELTVVAPCASIHVLA